MTNCVLPPEPYLSLMRAGLDPDREHDRVWNGHGRSEKEAERMAAANEEREERAAGRLPQPKMRKVE